MSFTPPRIEVLWGIAGTLSTGQNANFGRYRAESPVRLTSFDVNFVSAGVGGDTVVVFKLNDVIVATVTVPAGSREASVNAVVAIAVNDEIWPEIQSVASTTPPTTAVFRARN